MTDISLPLHLTFFSSSNDLTLLFSDGSIIQESGIPNWLSLFLIKMTSEKQNNLVTRTNEWNGISKNNQRPTLFDSNTMSIYLVIVKNTLNKSGKSQLFTNFKQIITHKYAKLFYKFIILMRLISYIFSYIFINLIDISQLSNDTIIFWSIGIIYLLSFILTIVCIKFSDLKTLFSDCHNKIFNNLIVIKVKEYINFIYVKYSSIKLIVKLFYLISMISICELSIPTEIPTLKMWPDTQNWNLKKIFKIFTRNTTVDSNPASAPAPAHAPAPAPAPAANSMLTLPNESNQVDPHSATNPAGTPTQKNNGNFLARTHHQDSVLFFEDEKLLDQINQKIENGEPLTAAETIARENAINRRRIALRSRDNI